MGDAESAIRPPPASTVIGERIWIRRPKPEADPVACRVMLLPLRPPATVISEDAMPARLSALLIAAASAVGTEAALVTAVCLRLPLMFGVRSESSTPIGATFRFPLPFWNVIV